MAGQAKKLIDMIIAKRSNGDPTLANTTKTKLILKGLNPDKFSALSNDDPAILDKIRTVARELAVAI